MSEPRDWKWVTNFFVKVIKGRNHGDQMPTLVSADSNSTAGGSKSRSSQSRPGSSSNGTPADNLAATAAVSDDAKSGENDIQAKGRATAAVVTALSCVLFALGVAWIFLFPLVTITTGEAKPRGTFFDENAMLVHHTSIDLRPADIEWAQPGSLRKAYPPQVRRLIPLLLGAAH